MAGSVVDPTEEVATQDEPVEDSGAEGTSTAGNGAGRRLTALCAVLLVLFVSAVAAATVFTVQSRDGREVTARNDAVLSTARAAAVNLVTLRYSSARDDLDRILASTTGDFRNQFSDVSGSFEKVLGDGQVDSTGQVNEAGVVTSDENAATVLAAVTSTVKNTEAPDGEERTYRMKISLEHIDESWLVSNVEFVA
jgi:Mce-associated membrane protein